VARLKACPSTVGHRVGNEAFVGRAPALIVEGLKKQAAETRVLWEKTKAALDGLPEE